MPMGRLKMSKSRKVLIATTLLTTLGVPAMAEKLREPADILDLPKVIDGRAMFTWDVWLSEVGLEGAEIKARHTFSEASLCLDATIAGQGMMLAWQTIASHQLQHGQLVAPFGPAVKTGFGHYFVTAETARRSDKVEKFKRWLQREIEDDMERLAKAAPVFA